MFKTVYIGDTPFDVTYNGTPIRPATFHNPAEGGEVEIETIEIGGIDVTEFLDYRTTRRIHQKLEEDLPDDLMEERNAALEDRAEQLYEERLLAEME